MNDRDMLARVAESLDRVLTFGIDPYGTHQMRQLLAEVWHHLQRKSCWLDGEPMTDPRPTPTRQQQADWLAEAARLHPAERFSLIAEHVGQLAYAAGLEAGRQYVEPVREEWL